MLNISIICSFVTLRVNLPTWHLVGFGVGERAFLRGEIDLVRFLRCEIERDRFLRGETEWLRDLDLRFSSRSLSVLLWRGRSRDFGLSLLSLSFESVFLKLRLFERDGRLLRLSPPLLDELLDDELELDDELPLLDELSELKIRLFFFICDNNIMICY